MQPLDITKYPDQEERIARDSFTAKLRKICAKLDACASQVVTCKDAFTGDDVTVAAQARGLWVFGSYARGALTCGDLDLILQLDYARACPRRSALTKAFVGTHPQVRVYHGTPEQNDTTLELPDAILTWEPGMDWAAALERIEANPSAGRFARTGDALPFRSEQDGLSLSQREDLADMHKKGILSWRFVPLSAIPQEFTPYEDPCGRCDEAWVLKSFGDQSAMKQKLAPVILGFARQLAAQHCPGHGIGWGDDRNIRLDTIDIQVGTLNPYALALDSYDQTAVAFIPALSTRGPNGFWFIERGPNHPLVQALADVQVWVHAYENGDLTRATYSTLGNSERPSVECDALEVYSSQQEAQEYADMYNENEDEDDQAEYRKSPRILGGAELLRELARADAVMSTSDDAIALTYPGQRYCVAEDTDAAIPGPRALAAKLRALLEKSDSEEVPACSEVSPAAQF